MEEEKSITHLSNDEILDKIEDGLPNIRELEQRRTQILTRT